MKVYSVITGWSNDRLNANLIGTFSTASMAVEKAEACFHEELDNGIYEKIVSKPSPKVLQDFIDGKVISLEWLITYDAEEQGEYIVVLTCSDVQ